MQTLFHAGFVSVREVDDVLVVGFADRQFHTSRYFLLQRGLQPEVDDGVYLEHMDQARGTFGKVASCALSSARVEMTVDYMTAESLGTDLSFAVEFPFDQRSWARLKAGLERVFAGTDCRLRLAAAEA